MAYGFTDQILRVNLTSGQITVEDSKPYQRFIGGAGMGDAIQYAEVPTGTKPLDEANKLIWAVGPSTGSSAPLSSRLTITTLSTFTKDNLPVHAHMGGNFAAKLKYAGYDAIILEGKSETPVYVMIDNDKVTIEDASELWGKGTHEVTATICREKGTDVTVAAIGAAGENMVNLSCIIADADRCGGAGSGAVMGSKKCKAVCVRGTGAVKVANSPEIFKLNQYMLSDLIGSNNNHVMPSTERPWAEFSSPGSRWTGHPGLTWGAAEGGPIDMGDSLPGDVNSLAYRCQKAYKDFGEASIEYTVKMNGCQSCPIPCHGVVALPGLKEQGLRPASSNTCQIQMYWSMIMPKNKDIIKPEDGAMFTNVACYQNADDLGLWDNYGEIEKTIKFFINSGSLEKILPKEEFDSLKWDLYEEGDYNFLLDVQNRIANNEGVIADLGMGAYFVNEKYYDIIGDDYLHGGAPDVWNALGSSRHHGNECVGQVGMLTNIFYNRDCMTHTIVNAQGSGLPHTIQQSIIDERFGEGAWANAPKSYVPVNENMIKAAKWGVVRQYLHDSYTLCNWVWPMTFSPKKERGYKGDLELEAKYYTAITGEPITEQELDDRAEAGLQLLRAKTVLGMNTMDMRNEHDMPLNWIFDSDPDIQAFNEGTVKMDREDWAKACTLMYRAMGWDEKTGAPTRATLEKFGLKDAADELESKGLLPA